MQEKYGFVYFWKDKKRKKYYIGSHWGHENDGYVCSSNYMYKAHKRRPQDFRRRILSRIYTNREDTFDEEYKWLQLIPDEQLGKKYYNFNKHKNSHWTMNESSALSIKQKISIKTKEAMARPEVRTKYENGLKSRNNIQSKETKKKRSVSMKATMANKFPIENRNFKLTDKQRKEYYSDKAKQNWSSPGFKEKTGKSISEALKASKQIRSAHMLGRKCYNNGIINIKRKEHPGDGWNLGRIKT